MNVDFNLNNIFDNSERLKHERFKIKKYKLVLTLEEY